MPSRADEAQPMHWGGPTWEDGPPRTESMRGVSDMVGNVLQQLQSAAARGGLPVLFGGLVFDLDDVAALEACDEAETHEVRFSNDDGLVGVFVVDLHDSGDPDDEGFTVGLRGWLLDDDVASV